MKARDLFLQISGVLQDSGAVRRWPWETGGDTPSLVDFLNSALRNVALNRPDATAVTEAVKLETGVRQRIPDPAVHQGATRKALRLLEVIQNMGSDGQSAGEPIFIASREAMQAFDWSATAGEIDNYAYDAKLNPDVFWVYPGVQAGADVYVELTYSAEPVPVMTPDDTLTLPETFAAPLLHWILYSIYAGDSDDASMARAQHHMRAFYQALGVKLKADLFFPVQVAPTSPQEGV